MNNYSGIVMHSIKLILFVPLLSLIVSSGWLFGTTGDVVDLVTVDTLDKSDPYTKIWEPHFAKWTDDHYVACYGLQVQGKGDMGDIVCSISLDKGKTWSPRIMVFDHRQRNGTIQFAYNNSIVFRPKGQDIIWLFCMRAPMHYEDSENADLVAAYTVDGGFSWQPVELALGYQGSLIVVAGIETVQRDGMPYYLLPAHRNSLRHDKTGDRRQFVLESTNLLHWKLADYVPFDDPVFLHEGKIAETEKQGELKIVMRTARMDNERHLESGLAYSSISKDGGQTWSVAQPEPELPNLRSKAFFGKDGNGDHIYVYSDLPERRALRYKTRKAGGEWSDARLFYWNDDRNSYPTLVEDAPGTWLAMWDSSDSPDIRRTAIRFGRLNVGR